MQIIDASVGGSEILEQLSQNKSQSCLREEIVTSHHHNQHNTRVRIHSKGPSLTRDGSKTSAYGGKESESNSRVRDASNESLERIHTFALKSSF